MRRTLRIFLAAAFMLGLFVYANNATSLAPEMSGTPLLLAHRGLAQTFHRDGLTNDTCTAERIKPPAHGYLENTLASMQAAFDAGADIVEFDIHPTTDGHFAVFHDWTVDCRTEGKGVTREHTLAEVKALDIGYGYTADGGKTFPFRGKGVGLMPSLDEVLAAFPDKRFLINIKSNDPNEGAMLAERLMRQTPAARARFMAYGGDLPISALAQRLPKLKVMSRASLKRCALAYLGLGWTGYVPRACRNTLVLVPVNYAGLLWGWPNRFLARMRDAGTDVFVTGPYASGDPGTSGIDDAAGYHAMPANYGGGIWTNRIDLIGPVVRTRP
jgi:glycerophosphoryl diester phosphodiesterase